MAIRQEHFLLVRQRKASPHSSNSSQPSSLLLVEQPHTWSFSTEEITLSLWPSKQTFSHRKVRVFGHWILKINQMILIELMTNVHEQSFQCVMLSPGNQIWRPLSAKSIHGEVISDFPICSLLYIRRSGSGRTDDSSQRSAVSEHRARSNILIRSRNKLITAAFQNLRAGYVQVFLC